MKHHRSGALYQGKCGDDSLLSEYWGESGDSVYTRGLQHQEDNRSRRMTNTFAKHLALHHPDQEGNLEALDFNLIQTFKHAAPRQTSESVHIHNSKADIILNSKVDF